MLLICNFFQGTLSHIDHVEDRSHLPVYTNRLEALSVKIDRISVEVIKKLPKQYIDQDLC